MFERKHNKTISCSTFLSEKTIKPLVFQHFLTNSNFSTSCDVESGPERRLEDLGGGSGGVRGGPGQLFRGPGPFWKAETEVFRGFVDDRAA